MHQKSYYNHPSMQAPVLCGPRPVDIIGKPSFQQANKQDTVAAASKRRRCIANNLQCFHSSWLQQQAGVKRVLGGGYSFTNLQRLTRTPRLQTRTTQPRTQFCEAFSRVAWLDLNNMKHFVLHWTPTKTLTNPPFSAATIIPCPYPQTATDPSRHVTGSS